MGKLETYKLNVKDNILTNGLCVDLHLLSIFKVKETPIKHKRKGTNPATGLSYPLKSIQEQTMKEEKVEHREYLVQERLALEGRTGGGIEKEGMKGKPEECSSLRREGLYREK